MPKEPAYCLPKFPRRHQYTWPKVEAQTHPLQAGGHDLKCSVPDKKTSLETEDGRKRRFEICKTIAEARRIYSNEYAADGEWKWLNENRRATYLSALHASDTDALFQAFSSLFRHDASYGIVTGTYADFCDATKKKSIINGILCDVDTWLDYTNSTPELYLSMPDVGMPYGVQFGDNLVSPDLCRHDYHAEKILRLAEDVNASEVTVLEIGGGYGGVAHQFFKRCSGKKHRWIIVDLFETLCVQYYWLSCCGMAVNFAIDGCIKHDSALVTLVPSDLADKINVHVDIVYNCNSFSEMARSTVENYFDLVNKKWKPSYIFHQNSDVLLFPDSPRHVEVLASEFPIGKSYQEIYRALSPWAGGNGRYREYLYEKLAGA